MDPDSKRLPPPRLRRAGEHGRSVSGRLRVAVSDGRGRAVGDGGLARWLATIAPRSASGEVAIALLSDARVRQLNRRYRHQDRPTDVLSFATAGARMESRRAAARRRDGCLGDIVIATGVARRQAREAGHSYTAELRILALHGLLHLLGYDHDDKANRGRMARLEARLRRKGGLSAGLIEREEAPRANT